MVNHIGVGTQAPESANLMRHRRVLGDRLIPDQPFSEPKNRPLEFRGRFFWSPLPRSPLTRYFRSELKSDRNKSLAWIIVMPMLALALSIM